MRYIIEFRMGKALFLTGEQESAEYDRLVGIAKEEGRVRVRMDGDLVFMSISRPRGNRESVIHCEFDGTMVEV